MSLKSRLLIMVISMLVAAIVSVSLLLSWSARQGTAEQTESDGRVLAQLLARGAGILDKLPEDMEHLIGEQMVTQAMFAAHLIAVAEGPKKSQSQILQHLRKIVESTNLDEIAITDSQGNAYIQTTPTPFPFKFTPDSKTHPKESEFHPLLTKDLTQYIQEGYIRGDEKSFKYAGVAGVDKNRIVQVGFNLSFLDNIRQRVGFQRLVEGLLESGSVEALWIVDNHLVTLAYGAKEDASPVSSTPSEIELDFLEKVINKGSVFSIFHRGSMKVMAPIIGKDDTTVGATVIHLPTDHLKKTLNDQLKLAAIVALCVLAIGVVVTYIMAQWVTHPVTEITNSAAEIEQGRFSPHRLDALARRQDELGRLARVFQGMAREVVNREERLDAMVKLRTKELEAQTKALQETLEKLKGTQTQLVAKEKMASLGQLTSGIAHELKNPLNFVINFSDVSAEMTEELDEALQKQKAKIVKKDWPVLSDLMNDIKENASRIKEHGKHAESIINSMIKHSRQDTGGAKVVDFNKFIKEGVTLYHHSLKGKDPDFKFELTLKLGKSIGQVEIVPQEMNRVIQNILENAHYAINEKANASPKPKGYKPEIIVSTQADAKQATLTIHDNGTGVPKNVISKIFDPLFTTKPTRKGNTGMGLSLSYDIVTQRHQGQLDVKSTEGEYAEFAVILPKTKNRPKTTGSTPEKSTKKAKSSTKPKPSPKPKAKK